MLAAMNLTLFFAAALLCGKETVAFTTTILSAGPVAGVDTRSPSHHRRRPSVIVFGLLDDSKSSVQGLLGDSKSVLPTSLPSMESIKISFDLPTIDMPDIKVPSLNLKSIELPSIDLPSMQLPSIDLPSIDFANPDLALPVIGLGLAAVAVAVLAAGGGEGRGGSTDTAATAKKSNNKASQLYAIPYDAAARLAYDSWRREHGDAPFNEEGYVHFQEIYIAKAVADATSKKLARDLEISFANKARPPAPPRQIAIPPTTPKTENATEKQPFFFAQLE